jgi:hypothetical protein
VAQTNKTSGSHVELNSRRVPARTLTIHTPSGYRNRAALQRAIAGDTLWLLCATAIKNMSAHEFSQSSVT